jgi:hypothetical protein
LNKKLINILALQGRPGQDATNVELWATERFPIYRRIGNAKEVALMRNCDSSSQGREATITM